MDRNEHLVEMRRICKRFGGIQALRNVDFYLDAEEIVGLVGDNGAGKSTLIKILSGVYVPDAGEIYFQGRRVRFESPQHAKSLGIETVHQDRGLVGSFDVPSNMFLGREPTRFGFLCRRIMEREARAAIARLGMEIPSFRTPVMNMSGGQQQAVAVGRAISTRPKVVIMDEPTAALAVKEVHKVLDLMRRLKGEGVAVVFISHVLQEVLAVTDRVVVLRKGVKVGDLATEEADIDLVVKLMVGTEEVGCAR